VHDGSRIPAYKSHRHMTAGDEGTLSPWIRTPRVGRRIYRRANFDGTPCVTLRPEGRPPNRFVKAAAFHVGPAWLVTRLPSPLRRRPIALLEDRPE